jgi:hypothetical protein
MRVIRLADPEVIVTFVPQRLLSLIGFRIHDLIGNTKQRPRVQAAYFAKLRMCLFSPRPERVQNGRFWKQLISYE